MPKELPEFRHLSQFGSRLLERVQKISEPHDNPPEEITIKAIDDLIRDTVLLQELVDDLDEMKTFINKIVMRLSQRGGNYLKVLGREDYVSPVGKIEVGGKWAFRMPKSTEEKLAFFAWMKRKGIFEAYATVNARSLQSLAMAEWESARKKDPDQWVLFELPGLPSPVFDEFTKIKGANARKSKRENNNDDDEN